MDERTLRHFICVIGSRLYQRGYISGSEGNISARLDAQHLLCTPGSVSKGFLRPEQICLVDASGNPVAGQPKPTSELPMHVAIYRAQPAAGAVIHAHCPYATALGVAGRTLPRGLLAEVEVFLGEVPLLPYETPGTEKLAEQVAAASTRHHAMMLKNHGIVVWAETLEKAWLLAETLEACCRVAWLAAQLGRIDLIPPHKLDELPKPQPQT